MNKLIAILSLAPLIAFGQQSQFQPIKIDGGNGQNATITIHSTNQAAPLITANNGLSNLFNISSNGVITAKAFYGDGSGLTNVPSSGSGTIPYYYNVLTVDTNFVPLLSNGNWQHGWVNGSGTLILSAPDGTAAEGDSFTFVVEYCTGATLFDIAGTIHKPNTLATVFPLDLTTYRQWIFTLHYSANLWVLTSIVGDAQESTD
jgi:hypothetical protein